MYQHTLTITLSENDMARVRVALGRMARRHAQDDNPRQAEAYRETRKRLARFNRDAVVTGEIPDPLGD